MNPQLPIEFKELIRDYQPIAYRMAFKITGGRESEAHDLVQEVWVKLWARWDSYKPDSLKSWMYRVIQNLYIDTARKRSRYPAISLDSPQDEVPLEESLPDRRGDSSKNLEQDEIKTEVRKALNQLDEQFRIPVMLCDLEGLPYETIAKQLACPVGTIRSRIHRGRSHLRKVLAALAITLAVSGWLLFHHNATQTPTLTPQSLEAQKPKSKPAPDLIALQLDGWRFRNTQ
jgi:RNA polymerase sigma-70 factor (ECF subfamily)